MELIISNLSKTYPNGVTAIMDVNLTIPTGMFGLLGPNGAGKSSLMRTIATLQEPDTGSIMLGDINVLTQKDELRQVLGYLSQDFGLYPKVTAWNLLDHFAVLKGISNKGERKEVVEALLQQTNLYEEKDRAVGGFSGGMRQRFGIAQALLGSPKLIIVDEPTAGLDPAERNRFNNLLSEIGENIIVVLSTHIVDDVTDLCTNMAILTQGQIRLTGHPLEVIEQLRGKIWTKTIIKAELAEYEKNLNIISTRFFAGQLVLLVLSENKPDGGFEPVSPTLDDVYFTHINDLQSKTPVLQTV